MICQLMSIITIDTSEPRSSRKFRTAANRQWLAQEDSSGPEAGSVAESFVPERSDHNSGTEKSASKDEDPELHQPTNQEPIQEKQPSESDGDDEPLSRIVRCFYSKNRYKWAKDPPNRAVRTGQHNIIASMPESKLNEQDEKDPFSLWKKLMTPDILEEILKWTNMKIRKLKLKYNRENRPEIQDINMIELQAFLGLSNVYGCVQVQP
ncbi:hypothetical protein EVAR_88558_1 [Eumeta japonica]|uniref:PiggyBac transposable element-derived protein domain-containing protein n=1 Tax=Eumeta variegata TaxID=151549 RepID=A0A4C1WLG6_EUMVA|nr:hypothetical protein EVAR_88558_1 [Eumeta japonica]